jgi:hypothetical protein
LLAVRVRHDRRRNKQQRDSQILQAARRRTVHESDSNEERQRGKQDTNHNERRDVEDEIRDTNEKHATEKRNENALAAAVDAIPHSNRAEKQAEEQKRRAHVS